MARQPGTKADPSRGARDDNLHLPLTGIIKTPPSKTGVGYQHRDSYGSKRQPQDPCSQIEPGAPFVPPYSFKISASDTVTAILLRCNKKRGGWTNHGRLSCLQINSSCTSGITSLPDRSVAVPIINISNIVHVLRLTRGTDGIGPETEGGNDTKPRRW